MQIYPSFRRGPKVGGERAAKRWMSTMEHIISLCGFPSRPNFQFTQLFRAAIRRPNFLPKVCRQTKPPVWYHARSRTRKKVFPRSYAHDLRKRWVGGSKAWGGMRLKFDFRLCKTTGTVCRSNTVGKWWAPCALVKQLLQQCLGLWGCGFAPRGRLCFVTISYFWECRMRV